MSTATPAAPTPALVVDHDKEIIDFLRLLGHGEFLGTLAEARLAVEKALSETGKAGEITIKIKQAPHGGNKRVLSFGIKTKLPVVPAQATYCFTTEAGQYLENNPDQGELPLKTVQFPESKLRQVPS